MMTIPTTDTGVVPVNGRKVKLWRKRRGLSQRDLAMATHISRGYIAEIESGKKRPSPVYTQAIATALGVSVGDLLTASGQ